MKTVVALVGDYWHAEEVVAEALEAAAGKVGGIQLKRVDHTGLAAAMAEKPDAVVLFKGNFLGAPGEDRKEWMTPELEAAVVEYVQGGGSWLAWHTGMAGFNKEGQYIDMLRGTFIHHPDMTDVTYYEAGSGKELVTLFDEHYFVECRESETEVYMTSTSKDGKSIAGWAHTFGAGKVCCLTPAHTREANMDERFQAILAERLGLLLS